MAHTLFLLVALGLDPSLDAREVSQALAIGQSRNQGDHTRFHQPYRLALNQPPIDYIEVVTPFRRVVLAAEERTRTGARPLSQREALEMGAAYGARVQLFVEMTFHPLNTFVGVPPYVVALVPAGSTGPAVAPLELERIPRHGPRVAGVPPGTPAPSAPSGRQEPVLGGTVVASFDGTTLNPNGIYDVVISESGKDGVRVRLNLATLR